LLCGGEEEKRARTIGSQRRRGEETCLDTSCAVEERRRTCLDNSCSVEERRRNVPGQ